MSVRPLLHRRAYRKERSPVPAKPLRPLNSQDLSLTSKPCTGAGGKGGDASPEPPPKRAIKKPNAQQSREALAIANERRLAQAEWRSAVRALTAKEGRFALADGLDGYLIAPMERCPLSRYLGAAQRIGVTCTNGVLTRANVPHSRLTQPVGKLTRDERRRLASELRRLAGKRP